MMTKFEIIYNEVIKIVVLISKLLISVFNFFYISNSIRISKYLDLAEWIINEFIISFNEIKKKINDLNIDSSVVYLNQSSAKYEIAHVLHQLNVKANEQNKIEFFIRNRSGIAVGEIIVNSYLKYPFGISISKKYKLDFYPCDKYFCKFHLIKNI